MSLISFGFIEKMCSSFVAIFITRFEKKKENKMNLTDNNLYLNNKEKNSSCNGYYCYKMDFNDNNIVYKYSCN